MKRAGYGTIGIVSLPSEVRQIWYTRNNKMKKSPRPIGAPLAELTEFEVLTAKDYAHKLIEITPLTQREEIIVAMYICAGFSLKEVAQVMDLTRESVRKIVIKILQKFRKAASELGEEWRDD
jgi:DNA-directed RNA polymerase specialized sigma subunit